jgi:hypothetical protein
MIISFTLSSKFSINWILSATLAPPKMAKNGLKQRINTQDPVSDTQFIMSPVPSLLLPALP